MKTLALVLVLIGPSAVVTARELPYEKMADCIAMCESGNNSSLVGDNGRARGAFQEWSVSVEEANRLGGSFTQADRTDPGKSRAICILLLKEFHKRHPREGALQTMARWRNPHGNAPPWYLRKLKRAMNQRDLRASLGRAELRAG